MAIIGTETEYGILAPDEPAADPEVLSAAVVDSYPGPGTPSLAETAAYLDRLAGRRLFVKAECLQHTGSFKYRGATAALTAMVLLLLWLGIYPGPVVEMIQAMGTIGY